MVKKIMAVSFAIVILCLSVFAIAGCSSGDKLSKLKIGMTYEEVESIFQSNINYIDSFYNFVSATDNDTGDDFLLYFDSNEYLIEIFAENTRKQVNIDRYTQDMTDYFGSANEYELDDYYGAWYKDNERALISDSSNPLDDIPKVGVRVSRSSDDS